MTNLPLTIVAQTTLKLTVGWTPPAGAAGYVFFRDGKRVSSTFDGSRSQATFGIPDGQPHTYTVQAISSLAAGSVSVNTATPAGGDPAADAFQRLWDATTMPPGSWSPPIPAVSQAALDQALAAAKPGTRIQPGGFTYHGRLALQALKWPLWIDADPTFEIVGPAGLYGQGLWASGCASVYVTGFPRIHNCGNQGLVDDGSTGCFFELDIRDCGGTGVLSRKAAALPSGSVFKIRGGNNGLDLSLDPHKQKGTGNHFMNAWQMQGGTVLLDIDDQPYGAGFESCALNATRIAVRAKSLSCDVDKLPAAPDGTRQTAGNGWQPWDGGAPGPHTNCVVEAVSIGSCAQAVYGALSGPGNTGNVVKVGRCASHRLSPAFAPLPGVTYQDVA